MTSDNSYLLFLMKTYFLKEQNSKISAICAKYQTVSTKILETCWRKVELVYTTNFFCKKGDVEKYLYQ